MIDIIVEKVLKEFGVPYEIIDFFPSGSDERQFSSPGFNLPVGSVMRTPYGTFPEYHTSADDLNFVKEEFLEDSFKKYLRVLTMLEEILAGIDLKENLTYINLNPKCEPQLGKRDLYNMIGGQKEEEPDEIAFLWVLNLSDGANSLLDISIKSNISFEKILKAAKLLEKEGLLGKYGPSHQGIKNYKIKTN